MAGSILNYPQEVPDPVTMQHLMILNDEFIIENILNDEQYGLNVNTSSNIPYAIPVNTTAIVNQVVYTAQNVCDHDSFLTFYLTHLGKNIKMYFEGHTYFGYMSDLVEGDEDITFTFTYTARIEQPEIPWGPLRL